MTKAERMMWTEATCFERIQSILFSLLFVFTSSSIQILPQFIYFRSLLQKSLINIMQIVHLSWSIESHCFWRGVSCFQTNIYHQPSLFSTTSYHNQLMNTIEWHVKSSKILTCVELLEQMIKVSLTSQRQAWNSFPMSVTSLKSSQVIQAADGGDYHDICQIASSQKEKLPTKQRQASQWRGSWICTAFTRLNFNKRRMSWKRSVECAHLRANKEMSGGKTVEKIVWREKCKTTLGAQLMFFAQLRCPNCIFIYNGTPSSHQLCWKTRQIHWNKLKLFHDFYEQINYLIHFYEWNKISTNNETFARFTEIIYSLTSVCWLINLVLMQLAVARCSILSAMLIMHRKFRPKSVGSAVLLIDE